MKATKLLLIVLSCMLVIGCKKNKSDDEPTPPTPQYPLITMDTLKHYFPYETIDRQIFNESDGFMGFTYIVKEATFASKDNKITANILMEGYIDIFKVTFTVQLKAEVTDQHLLKTTLSTDISGVGRPKEASFEYDTAKEGALPDQLNYSNEAIVEKGKGLTHYIDGYGQGWDLFHTYYK